MANDGSGCAGCRLPAILAGETIMLFSRQLPLASLIEFCRVLRYNLSAGLTLRHVFRQQAKRGPLAVRPVAARISDKIEEGESLEAALKHETDRFPPLFVSLAVVGEETGNLPEVLAELEKYYLLLQRLRRQFISQIAWPAIEFILAPFVLAGMIFLLAILGSNADPLGLGYTGVSGAIKFLVHFWGMVAVLIGLYFLLTRTLKQKATVDHFLLRLWAIGPCVYALAMTRFCLALRLTMETGMPIAKALRLSMRATGNQAFASRADDVVDSVRTGKDLTQTLRQCGLFTEEFLNILANAEEGGRVVEVMAHQADYYEDEARRKMTILTRVASWGFYAFVAAMLIFMILRMYMRIYIGPINQFLS
jgi:type IV pilus assembly protein PilC